MFSLIPIRPGRRRFHGPLEVLEPLFGIPFDSLAQALEDAALWQLREYKEGDREVHFDRQTGKMLGWFIEHRPSRVTRLFGTIIGRAETELDVPREMTTRSLRSSIRMDGGFGEKTDRLDEFLDLVSPPRR